MNTRNNDSLAELKIGCLGDSITFGVGADTTYVDLLKNDFREAVAYGVCGSCVTPGVNPVKSLLERYPDMADDLDVIVIFGGTNDVGHNVPFGNDDNSTDPSDFKGALNCLITGVMEKYPEKTIVYCTPAPRYYDGLDNTTPNAAGVSLKMVRDQIISRCMYYSMPCLDIYGMSGMNISYSESARKIFTFDGLHLNDRGHQRVYELLIGFIRQLKNA